MFRKLFLLNCACLLMLASNRAISQELDFQPKGGDETAVEARIRDLERQVQQLNLAASQPEMAEDAAAKAGPAEFPNVKLTGFFQLDTGFYSQDDANRATLGDIQDGTGFRRARLAAVGKVAEQTSYVMEFDFAQAQPRFVDLWVQFEKTPIGNLRIGRFREPFGMTELTGIRELPFLERPLIFATDLFLRQTGVMLSDSDQNERINWSVSGFRYLTDSFGNLYSDDGGYGMATRFSCLPIDLGNRLLHLGFDYSYKDPGRDQIQLANTNEFFLGQNPLLGAAGLSVLPLVNVPAFVNTGPIAARSSQVVNLEAAAARQPADPVGGAMGHRRRSWRYGQHVSWSLSAFAVRIDWRRDSLQPCRWCIRQNQATVSGQSCLWRLGGVGNRRPCFPYRSERPEPARSWTTLDGHHGWIELVR